MASGFDELVEQLLEHVALNAFKGLGNEELTTLVKTFYDERNKQERQQTSEDSQDLLFLNAPPRTTTTVVDDRLIDTLWEWLSQQPDINVIDVPDGRSNGKPIVLASECILPDVDDSQNSLVPPPIEAPQSAHRHAGKRLVTTEEKIWHAITGHGIDFHRVPRLEFECLQVIAARGETGILQPEITSLTGQDKRSVPKRTDALAAKGYITKTRVCAIKLQTTLMKLARYGQARSSDLPPVPSKAGPDKNEPVIYYDKWWDTLITLLRSQHNGVVALDDLRIELGVKGRYETRALRRCIRRLMKTRFLTLLSAAVVGPDGNVTKKNMRCVRMLREPGESDSMAFRAMYKRPRTSQAHIRAKSRAVVEDPDEDSSEDNEDDDRSQATGQELDFDSLESRTAPQWTPDKPYPNLLFEIVHNAGYQGISSMDLSAQTMGPIWRRPFDELMMRLTDAWQKSQPSPLRHLTLVRNASVQNKFCHYAYWSYENFQEAVERGNASWEAAMSGTSFGGKVRDNSTIAWPKVVLDEWGFPPLQAELFEGDGWATLAECRKSTGGEHLHADVASAVIDMSPSATRNLDQDSTPLPVSLSIMQKRRSTGGEIAKVPTQKRKPHPISQNEQPKRKPRVVSQNVQKQQKPRVVSQKEQEEFKKWSHVTATRLVKMEMVRGDIDDQPPMKRRRTGDAESDESIDDQAHATEAERISQVEQELLTQTRAGVYINPPGAHSLKVNTVKLPGRPRIACIAVFKTERLKLLPCLNSDRAGNELLDVDEVRTGNKRKRGNGENFDAESVVLGALEEDLPRIPEDATHLPEAPDLAKEAPAQTGDVEPTQTAMEKESRHGMLAAKTLLPASAAASTASASITPSALEEAQTVLPPLPSSMLGASCSTVNLPVATSQYISETSPRQMQQPPSVIMPKRKPGRPSKAMVAERQRLRQQIAEEQATEAAKSMPNVIGRPPSLPSIEGGLPQVPATGESTVPTIVQTHRGVGARHAPQVVASEDEVEEAHVRPKRTSSSSDPLGVRQSASVSAAARPSEDTTIMYSGLQDREPQHRPHRDGSTASTVERGSASFQKAAEDVNEGSAASATSEKTPASPAAVRNGKVGSASRVHGIMFHQRTKIVMDIMQQCDGVYPGNREIYYPFATAWERLHGLHPDRHTVDRVVKGLVDNLKLKKVVFSFKTQKGLDRNAPILMLPEVDHRSEKVVACKERMMESYPASYIPPEADVSPELRQRPANHPVPGGRKLSDNVRRFADGQTIHTAPPQYSRDRFPMVEGMVVKRTDAGLTAAQSHAAKISEKRRSYQFAYDRTAFYDSDPNGTNDDEMADEQLAMQGEMQLESYVHNPNAANIQRRNGMGKLSRRLVLDPAYAQRQQRSCVPSVKSHSLSNHQRLSTLDSPPGTGLEQRMPDEIRALLMRPGTQAHSASGTIGTNATMDTVTDKDHIQASLARKKPIGQQRLQSLQSLLQPNSQQTPSSRLANQMRRNIRKSRLYDSPLSLQEIVRDVASDDVPAPLGKFLGNGSPLGHASTTNREGPAYRFFREIERVEAWEIDHVNSGTQPSGDLAGTFVNHVFNQDLVEPELDEDFLLRERQRLKSATQATASKSGLPSALNNDLSALLVKFSPANSARAKNPEDHTSRRKLASRAPWSSAEEDVLRRLLGDAKSKRKSFAQLVEEFCNEAGTLRTWAAMHQHYRKMDVAGTAEDHESSKNVTRRPRRSTIEDSNTFPPGRITPTSELLYIPGDSGRPPKIVENVLASLSPDAPWSENAQLESPRVSINHPSRTKDASVTLTADVVAPSTVSTRKEKHKYKSRKRKAAPEDDDYAASADDEQFMAPPKKRTRKTKIQSPFREPHRLMYAIVVVATLTGGTGQSLNWSLIAHAMSFKYDDSYLKNRWTYLKIARESAVHELQETFRMKFLSAYEAGILPSIDFQKLQKTDWPAMVDWLEREIVSSKPEATPCESEIPDLKDSRAELEAMFDIRDSAQPCAPDREHWYTGVTDILRGNTALKLIHGNSIPVIGPASGESGDDLMLAKSWFRAVIVTKDSRYNAASAAQKMRAFSGSTFSRAQSELLADQVIMQVRSGRQLPGRNFIISKRMWRELSRWPKGDAMYLREVAGAREAVLAHFEMQDRLELALRPNDAEFLVLTNMVAQGLVKIITDLPARNDDPDAPWPKLSIWGYTDFEYETKRVQRSRIRFPVAYERTPSLTAKHGLKPALPIPMQGPHVEGEMARRIPFWIDIHGNLMADVWDLILHSVLHILVFRPGITLQGMEEAHHGRLWEWEIQMVVLWMERTGLALRIERGAGWMASEWWYCALTPEIATWSAPGEMEGDARGT